MGERGRDRKREGETGRERKRGSDRHVETEMGERETWERQKEMGERAMDER